MAKKTKLMLGVEKEQGRSLERLLPEMVNKLGLTRTAEELGVSRATLTYWLLKLGIGVRRTSWALRQKRVEAFRRSDDIPHRRTVGFIKTGPDEEGQLKDSTNAELLKALARAQKLVRQYVPEGRSLADELIKHRRAEAAAE